MSLSSTASASVSEGSNLRCKNGIYYTRWGLVVLFAYLLLGDFCLQFMEAVVPSIMPLQLDAAGASNTIKAAVMGTSTAFFNMVLNPYISFKSDGMRTAWGRRRPILLLMTPFVCLALVLVAFAPEISRILQVLGLGKILHGGILPADPSMSLMVVALAFSVIVFQIFNYLMQPVFYYLFVDVVPDHYIGRFVALFRVVATMASLIFQSCIYSHAMTHTRAIYLGSAVLYAVGFLVMILKVKEGTYPPPVHGKIVSAWGKVRTYARECYSHRHYLLFYARNTFFVLSMAADMFLVFFLTKSLHISLADIGGLAAKSTLLLLILLYPFGILADRFKPLRVSLAMMLVALPMGLVSFFFITDLTTFLVLGFANNVLKGLVASLELPFYASVPPQDRYGQFGSANQLFISVFMIGGTLLAGVFMDWFTEGGARPEMYRYCYIWGFACFTTSTFFMYLLYLSWRKHGGPNDYIPPSALDPIP